MDFDFLKLFANFYRLLSLELAKNEILDKVISIYNFIQSKINVGLLMDHCKFKQKNL